MTFEIAKRIENILQKYGISSVLEFNQGIRTSYYMDMILKATPWELRLGSAKYEDLLDLMNLVIDLKCPMSRCMIGDTPIDDPFRNIFLSGIRHYLKETLGKGKCSNYKYLIEFMNEIDTAGMKVYMVEQLPYLLEERIESRLSLSGQSYDSLSKKDFSIIVQEETQFLLNHPEEFMEVYMFEPLWVGSVKQDEGLLGNCLPILDGPSIPREKRNLYKEHLQKVWTFCLGRVTVEDILQEYYMAVFPEINYSEVENPLAVSFDYALSHLPYPMASPEYQYVKRLHSEYKVVFNESWAHPELSPQFSLMTPSLTMSYEDYPQWEDSSKPHELQYLVSQYLYFCLTNSILPGKDEKNTMIRTGAIIYDLLCALGYRKSNFSMDDDFSDKAIQKDKYDLIKRYIQVDKSTGMYKRIK